jgi:hypothetical protein
MIEIGTVKEEYQGEPRLNYKVRLGWELPTELKVYKEERGEEPAVISRTYTLSMHEKANLRKDLESWRGQTFSEKEAKEFDITKLLGVPCMLNILHKKSKDGNKTYERISSITTLMKGYEAPKAINPIKKLEYDSWNQEIFDSLPEFLQNEIKGTPEYQRMREPNNNIQENVPTYVGQMILDNPIEDDLPF